MTEQKTEAFRAKITALKLHLVNSADFDSRLDAAELILTHAELMIETEKFQKELQNRNKDSVLYFYDLQNILSRIRNCSMRITKLNEIYKLAENTELQKQISELIKK